MTQEEINSLKVNETIRALDEDESGEWVRCRVTHITNQDNVHFKDETGGWVGLRWDVSKEELLDDNLYLKP